MDNETLEFLQEMLDGFSPSGFEAELQNRWIKRSSEYADKSFKDVHGNAIAVRNPDAKFKVMLAGHADEIGLMVMNITDEGMLEIDSIGGFDPLIAPGTHVRVMTRNGLVNGVVGKPIRDDGEDKKIFKISDMWVDIGASSRERAAELVRPGDPISPAPCFTRLADNFIAAKGQDDRVGSFVCSEVLRLLHGREFKAGLWSVSTVQEEVGSRGAVSSGYNIDADVAIAIDVGYTADYPTSKKRRYGDVRVGGGPILNRGANINPVLEEMLEKTAEKNGLPYQISPVPKVTWTDANPLQMLRGGRAAALVRVPLRYMHSTAELSSLDDIENASRLLAELIAAFTGEESFIP